MPWLIRLRENFRCTMATGVLSLYHADRKVGEASGQPYIDLEREAEAMLIRE